MQGTAREYSQYFTIILYRVQPIKISNYYVVYLKLIQYCKSTTFQLFLKKVVVFFSSAIGVFAPSSPLVSLPS